MSSRSNQTFNQTPVILVVENDDDNRLMLKYLLEIWDYRAVEAHNGLEAVRLAEKIRPDVILMDIKLPLLNGLDAARQIRQSEKTSGVPIVFVTGCAEATYRGSAFSAGGSEYLTKPFNFETLLLTIRKFTKNNRAVSSEFRQHSFE